MPSIDEAMLSIESKMDGCKGSVMQERSDADELSSQNPRGTCPKCCHRLERNQINYFRWFACPCCGSKLVCSTAHRKFPKIFGICAVAATIIYSAEVTDVMAFVDLIIPLALVCLLVIYRVIPLPQLTVCTQDPDEQVQTLGLTK